MAIWYFGTPEFAVAPLKALLDSGEKISLVVTQPDRPAGRKGELKAPEVKVFAQSHGLPVYQPEKVRSPEVLEHFQKLAANDRPELAVVTAFGQIIPQALLDIPVRGFWNVHASVLPKLRGASPIQAAVTEGFEETGVTLMQMDAGLDTGDMLVVKSCRIEPNETAGELHDKLMPLGAEALIEGLRRARDGILKPVRQDSLGATYAAKLTRESGTIDWKKPAASVANLIRGLNPWPSAQTTLNGERIKIHKAIPAGGTGEPGTVLSYDPLTVACGNRSIEIIEIQREGKRAMAASDFVRGLKLPAGSRFGS